MKLAQGSVEPTPAPPVLPLMALLFGAATITPTLLLAEITKFVEFPAALLRMIRLPALSTSMPRSLSDTAVLSIRLSELMT